MGLKPVSGKIGVVGTGVIGASWAALFLANGFDVAATDPADGAETRLRALVDRFWPALERIGLAEGASREGLRFDPIPNQRDQCSDGRYFTAWLLGRTRHALRLSRAYRDSAKHRAL